MKAGAARGQEALARAVTAARSQPVDPDALARVQARVLADACAQSMAAPAAVPASSASSWTILGGGIVLVAGAVLLGLRDGAPVPVRAPATPRDASVAPSVDAPKPSIAVSAAPIASEPVISPGVPAAMPEKPAAHRASSARRASVLAPASSALPAEPSTRDRTPDPAAELALLRRALLALPGQPTLALELAEQHAREHVHGVFAQEREAIAIDASLALQRTADAETRVRRFLAMYPRSPHAPRLRALLGPQDGAAVRTHQ